MRKTAGNLKRHVQFSVFVCLVSGLDLDGFFFSIKTTKDLNMQISFV